MNQSRRSVLWIPVLAGMALLAVNLIGLYRPAPMPAPAELKPWNRFDPALASRIKSINDAAAFIRSNHATASEHETMRAVYGLVIRISIHGLAAHDPFSNWILWGMGLALPPFRMVYDADALLRRGHAHDCSQSSYLLLRIAETLGIRARHVGLNGHVVMEAFYDGAWHMYDPDFEVIPEMEGRVLSVRELAASRETLLRLYGVFGEPEYVERIADIFATDADNNYVAFPKGARFTWKAEALALFERAAGWLKWILPILMITLPALHRRRMNHVRN